MPKNRNLIIKSFVVLFVALLFFPNLGLFRGDKNVAMIAKENRKITAFPKESPKEKMFYSNFEKWYQDRLRYRDKAIKRWRKMNFAIGVLSSHYIFMGQDNWMFNKNRYVFSFNDAQIKLDKIKGLQDFCQNNGAKFAVMIPPSKEAVYASHFPMVEKGKQENYLVWEKQLESLMLANGINYLSVADELFDYKQRRDDDLYFRDDHHWSYYGALIGTNVLLDELDEAHIMLDGTTKIAFKESSYAIDLGIGSDLKTVAPWNKDFSTEIYVTDSKGGKRTKVDGVVSNDILWGKLQKGEGIIENLDSDNSKVLLVLGDSYSSYMMPYLSQKFAKIISTHYRDCVAPKKSVDISYLLKKYKPDVVLLEKAAPGLFRSKGDSDFKNIVF